MRNTRASQEAVTAKKLRPTIHRNADGNTFLNSNNMDITTKFNVGDKLWTIKDCKAYEFEVDRIRIYANKTNTDVYYYPKCDVMSSESYKEDNCYSSKEELIKAL